MVFIASSCATAKTAPAPTQEAAPAPSDNSGKSPRPKYDQPKTPVEGPAAVRLFDSQDYVRKKHAPDFWALAPYYIPQLENTCAASSIAMVLNALRAHRALTADDALVTTANLIAKVNDPLWTKSMQEKKCYDLDSLAGVVREALQKYGFTSAEVKVVHVKEDSKEARAELRKALVENESSDRNFIIANFLQGQFTGDPEGTGHVSPVGAYDKSRHRVLVMDVDREYYEPYWVTEDIFFAGMNTKDEGVGKSRGYLFIQE